MKGIKNITIPIPIDRHGHLRKAIMAKRVVPHNNLYSDVITFGNFADDPVDDADGLIEYREFIRNLKPKFKPHFGLMVTSRTTPAIVEEGFYAGAEFLKTMFVGTTTGSSVGISIDRVEEKYPSYDRAGELGMPTLWHMERMKDKRGKQIPLLYREEEAIPDAKKIIHDLPDVKISIEHISTAVMIETVESAGPNVIGGFTAHHAFGLYKDVCNKNGELINPHNLCMPILKRKKDRDAVRRKMTHGDYKKFRPGTDSAAHWPEAKLEGAPGIFVPDFLVLALYCQIFEEEGMLHRFGSFVSCNQTDMDFYGFYQTSETITLVKEEWIVPMKISGIVPYMAGKKLQWKVKK